MGKLVHLSNATLDPIIKDEQGSLGPKLAAQCDLTADFTGIETAASKGTSR